MGDVGTVCKIKHRGIQDLQVSTESARQVWRTGSGPLKSSSVCGSDRQCLGWVGYRLTPSPHNSGARHTGTEKDLMLRDKRLLWPLALPLNHSPPTFTPADTVWTRALILVPEMGARSAHS